MVVLDFRERFFEIVSPICGAETRGMENVS